MAKHAIISAVRLVLTLALVAAVWAAAPWPVALSISLFAVWAECVVWTLVMVVRRVGRLFHWVETLFECPLCGSVQSIPSVTWLAGGKRGFCKHDGSAMSRVIERGDLQ